MHRLLEALPAVADRIALIDLLIGRDIKKGAKISLEIVSGDYSILLEHIR